MKDNKQVYSKIEDNIMTITIDNPEMKNGLNWAGLEQLSDCLEQLNNDKSIRVAVIMGNDEYFYTGGRVDPTIPGEQELYANAIDRYETLMSENTTPMVAAISGNCLKAGMGLIANCDFAIARQGVVFGFPEARMGGVPMMVMVSTIDTMPKKRALEAYLTSWEFSAEEAYSMGLINRVTTDENFWPTVDKFVKVLIETPEHIIKMTRRAYNEMSKLTTESERKDFAMGMLRSEVLTKMAQTKTEYNV